MFCEKIGGDCHEVADKFESLKEIFNSNSVNIFEITIGSFKGKEYPC